MKSIDLVVMDWGIGGLSVYSEILRTSPGLNILYFSDSGSMPYGKMPTQKLKNRVRELIFEFSNQGAKHFVIACNAASTVLPSLQKEFIKHNLHVTGVIERGIELVKSTSYNNLGVIGGRRTILSKSYSIPLASKKRKVKGRVAQPLSALIERGELSSPHMTKTLTQILRPLENCDALLLACTHYPAVSDQIQTILPNCKLLDPAMTTANYIRKNWDFKRARKTRKSSTLFVTSGDARQMKKTAKAAFGIKISNIIKHK
jgi:glutamate racemase